MCKINHFPKKIRTTIGFGDYSPTKSFTDAIAADATAADLFKLIIGTAYLSIGLALIAMCISLIQEQAARTANSAVGKKSEVIELDQIQIVARNSSWNQVIAHQATCKSKVIFQIEVSMDKTSNKKIAQREKRLILAIRREAKTTIKDFIALARLIQILKCGVLVKKKLKTLSYSGQA